MIPGELLTDDGEIELNPGRRTQTLVVENMFVGIIVITILGVLSTFLLHELERRLIPWRND